jgi:hypothetical protein
MCGPQGSNPNSVRERLPIVSLALSIDARERTLSHDRRWRRSTAPGTQRPLRCPREEDETRPEGTIASRVSYCVKTKLSNVALAIVPSTWLLTANPMRTVAGNAVNVCVPISIHEPVGSDR